MAVYLKKTDDGKVIAMRDMRTVEKFGGTYDKKVSDSNWFDKCNGSAHLNEKGEIVLGMSDDELKEKQSEHIRNVRNRKLHDDCDSLSALMLASMTTAEKNKWMRYRQALLDIPQQNGFPWSGDDSKAPWPTKPE